jgi:hypothetical protein
MPRENLVDKAKETVGLGQTPVTEAAKGDQPLDREKAFDALGVSVVEEYGEWKPDGAPLDSFRAMHNGQMRMVGGPDFKNGIAMRSAPICRGSRQPLPTKSASPPPRRLRRRVMNPRTAAS